VKNVSLLIFLRRLTQLFFFILFLYFLRTFLSLDPLLSISIFFSIHRIPLFFLLSFIVIIATLFLGRFFCGWICPLGTLNQIISFIFKKILFKKRREIFKPAQKIKYLFLLILLILAFLKVNISGLFSPLIIFYRGFHFINRAFLSFILFINKYINLLAIDRIFYWFQDHIEDFSFPKYDYAFFNIGLFFIILFLNIFSTRFWCRFICPLGGFLGFISQRSFLNISRRENCKNCLNCTNNCQGACNPHLNWIKQECLFCLNCLICPQINLNLSFGKSDFRKIDLSKRQLLYTIGSTIFIYPLLKFGFYKKNSFEIIRPPGARKEDEFLNYCIRCQACIRSCPTHFLQPLLFEKGIAGIFTPYGNQKTGYCKYECNLCGKVCPTQAIKNLTLSEKQKFKIGTAFINKARCLVYSEEIDCLQCYGNCPLRDKAIVKKEIKRGLFAPEIISEVCLGCALCANICPAQAIVIKKDKNS